MSQATSSKLKITSSEAG